MPIESRPSALFDRRFLPHALFEFVIVSDTHFILNPEPYAVEFDSVRRWSARVERALQLVADLQPELVIHLGDQHQEQIMRYIIYGAGGIGSSMGGHLLRTGHQSILIGRPGHVNAINRSGLTLNTPHGNYNLKIPAVTSPKEVEWSPDDVVMLCMKSQDTEGALRALNSSGPDSTQIPVFCAQNSITNEPAAARYFDRVYAVMVGFTGIYLEEGTVYNPVEGNAGYLEIGLYPNAIDELAKHVASDLRTHRRDPSV